MSEPTNAELVHRIDQLVRQQEAMLGRVDQLLRDVAQMYATKERVEALENLHNQRLKELEKDNESAAGFRRQVAAGFIVGFLLLLLPLLGAIQSIAAAGGPTP